MYLIIVRKKNECFVMTYERKKRKKKLESSNHELMLHAVMIQTETKCLSRHKKKRRNEIERKPNCNSVIIMLTIFVIFNIHMQNDNYNRIFVAFRVLLSIRALKISKFGLLTKKRLEFSNFIA